MRVTVDGHGKVRAMRLGFHTGYWSAGPPPGAAEVVAAADALGLDSVWTAEAYGSDALTPLAWWGASTQRVRLGTGICQMAARTPTATAMAALTLDHLSGGRFVLGLGASGPQVVEGWYGQPYPRPLARTREYVRIVRDVLARQAPVTHDGAFFHLPYRGDGASGLGKALRSTVHPLRQNLPIHLAAQGPRNVALAAEIADGWLPAFFSPRFDDEYRERLAKGFALRAEPGVGGPCAPEAFEVSATVPVALGEDVESAADQLRPHVALYVGGMGASGANFHRAALERLGYADACSRVAAAWDAGDRTGAAAAVPTELVLDVALAGSARDLAEQTQAWRATVVTTLVMQADPRQVPAIVAALQR